jgi:hypothetical protein
MKSASRLSHILHFTPPDGVIESFGLVGAYCACLTPEEAAGLLLASAKDRLDIRDAVLRKVCADIDIAFAKSHEDVLDALVTTFTESDSRGRQSLGYCLSTLATHVPPPERRRIQTTFLRSKYIGIRRRAYKSISLGSDILFEEVQAAWQDYSDPECAWLIAKTFPADFLVAHRAELEAVLTEGWQLSRLYMRIAETNPSVLDELKSRDEISYCYVLAKLKKPLRASEAIQIVNQMSNDDRFGLLVWSFGQQRLWAVLQYIEAQLPAIQERKIEALKKKHGL